MTTIKNWLLVFLCYLYAPVRGSATRVPRVPSRIVIVQMAKLGDMVCTTPVMSAIKRVYPDAQVTVVGQKANAALLAGHPDIDAYVPFEGLLPLIRTLRAKQYDYGILAGPNTFLLAALILGRVRAVAAPLISGGRSPLVTPSYRALTRLICTRPHRMGTYAPREYLRLLEPIGIETDLTTKSLAYTENAAHVIERFLSERPLVHPIVGIAPAAGNKVKEWPPERFAAVADALITEGASIVLIGGPNDVERGEEVRAASLYADRIVNGCGKFSLDESKALIASLDLFVSVDTGPIYIAEAFGVATVDIVGPMDEREQPPRGPRNLVVTPPAPRVPQLHIMDAHPKDPAEALRQAESIPVEDVIAACRRLLKEAIV